MSVCLIDYLTPEDRIFVFDDGVIQTNTCEYESTLEQANLFMAMLRCAAMDYVTEANMGAPEFFFEVYDSGDSVKIVFNDVTFTETFFIRKKAILEATDYWFNRR